VQVMGTLPQEKAVLDKLKPPASTLDWLDRQEKQKNVKVEVVESDSTKEAIEKKIAELEAKKK